MIHNLATAAQATGLNRSTILRAVKAGKISATKDSHGGWSIDPAELHRVYPPATAQPPRPEAEQPQATANDDAQHRAELAEQRLADLKVIVDEIRADRDAWRDQAQRLALPDQRPRSSWWRRAG